MAGSGGERPAGALAGRTAVVTAAASGIGWAIARRFAREGARVVLGDIRGDAVAERAAELDAQLNARLKAELSDGQGELTEGKPPAEAVALRADVTAEPEVEALMQTALDRFGRLDIAVNCAGISDLAPVVDADADAWRATVEVCLTGTMLGTKHAARRMADGGAVLNIASLNAVQPAEGMSAYCAAKAGVLMLTQVSAMELGPRGIRVNAIAPGLVDTPLTAGLFQAGLQDEFLENTPLGRYGEPSDIAESALFLVSDAASWISGEVLHVDGAARTKRYPELLRRLTGPA
jgi:NAD(P)-dependent dehydrogenase (short-subunit alcohol dehydrogenase family)